MSLPQLPLPPQQQLVPVRVLIQFVIVSLYVYDLINVQYPYRNKVLYRIVTLSKSETYKKTIKENPPYGITKQYP